MSLMPKYSLDLKEKYDLANIAQDKNFKMIFL